MIKTMPVWTLAIALMAVTASPSNAQSKTPVSSGSATNSIINESTLRQPNAIYSSFGQSSSALSQPTQAPLSNIVIAP